MIFFKKYSVLFRCNYCFEEVSFSQHSVDKLEAENQTSSVCPIITECHFCHIGFVIPVNYKSKNGKIYKFNQLANKIPHLNPDTFLDRLLDEDNF